MIPSLVLCLKPGSLASLPLIESSGPDGREGVEASGDEGVDGAEGRDGDLGPGEEPLELEPPELLELLERLDPPDELLEDELLDELLEPPEDPPDDELPPDEPLELPA